MMRRAVGAWDSLKGDRVWYAPIPRRPRKQQGSPESTAFNQPRRTTASESSEKQSSSRRDPAPALFLRGLRNSGTLIVSLTLDKQSYPTQCEIFLCFNRSRPKQPPHPEDGGEGTRRRPPLHDCNLPEPGPRPFALEASFLIAPPVAERQGYLEAA